MSNVLQSTVVRATSERCATEGFNFIGKVPGSIPVGCCRERTNACMMYPMKVLITCASLLVAYHSAYPV